MQCLRRTGLLLAGLALAAGCRFSLHGDPLVQDADLSSADGVMDLATDDLVALSDIAVSDLSTSSVPDLATADMTVVVTPSLVGTKAKGPTSVNLSTEGTIDWIHLGLTAATDVNRKAAGGSKISVTASSTLAQYTMYATTFSWNDGAPSASATNTPNGVYVLGNGKGFTIAAPADATQHALRLYLNVGGTASVTAHLSDGSAPDYVDSQSSPSDGTTYLYTLRYTASGAGTTLTVTWQLTSGSGVSFVAASLQ